MPNTYSQIYLHYVFSPKYRKALILSRLEVDLYKYITGIVKNLDQTLIRINGMPDHCHLLVRMRPSMAPAKFIQQVKTGTSLWINKENFLKQNFKWQTGGGVFSVGYRQVPMLIDYIDNQKDHHKVHTFKDEYLGILNEAGIKYKEDYLLEFFG